jgi:ParB family chromosome partitioning protein
MQPVPMPTAPPGAPVVMRPAAEQPPAPPAFFSPAPPVVTPLRPAATVAPVPANAPAPPAPVASAPIAPVIAAPGAAMLAATAIAPANLGTRRGEDIPEGLLTDIATRGVRQPIIVRRSAANAERYELICGHRRWRAAQRVGLSQLPATVVVQDDATAILTSLAENLQSGTLAVMDEAQAYLRLLTQCATDASAVTAATGSDRKHIVQTMRLLGLPPLVRHLVSAGTLSRELAYLLLDAPNPETLADAILAEGLSVDAVKQRLNGGTKS